MKRSVVAVVAVAVVCLSLSVALAASTGAKKEREPTLVELVRALDSWRERIGDEGMEDSVSTAEQLSRMEQKEGEAVGKLDEAVDVATREEPAVRALASITQLLTHQQDDVRTVVEVANGLARHYARVCEAQTREDITADFDVLVPFLDDLKQYVHHVQQSIAAKHAQELAEQDREASLLGINSGFNCNHTTTNVSLWSEAKRSWCCAHRGVGCRSGEAKGPSRMWSVLYGQLCQISDHVMERRHELAQTAKESQEWCHQQDGFLSSITKEIEELSETINSRYHQHINSLHDKQTALKDARNATATLKTLVERLQAQRKTIRSASTARNDARRHLVASIDAIRKLVMALETPSSLSTTLSSLLSSGTPSLATTGKSAATSVRTCFELKRVHPSAESGVYWVHLGAGAEGAFQAYCDMDTEGGGWTVVSKVAVGELLAAVPAGRNASHDSAKAPILPAWASSDMETRVNDKAFEFFSERPRQQWLKTMMLFRSPVHGSAPVPMISQSLLAVLQSNSLQDMTTLGEESGCRVLETPVKLFGAPPSQTPSLNTHPLTQLLGVSRHVTSPTAGCSGVGLAAMSSNLNDQCGLDVNHACSTRDLVCSSPLSGVHVNPQSNAVSLSSVHSSALAASLFSSGCVFACPAAVPGAFAEVAVFAARPDVCPSNVAGEECSGQGVCTDGVCKCGYGFGGEACEYRLCMEPCVWGACEDGVCVCEQGYTGPHCNDTITCAPLVDTITHVRPANSFESGEVRCTGNAFGNTCARVCDDDYRMQRISAVTLKLWADQCSGAPDTVVNVPVNTCARVSSNSMIHVTEPDHARAIEARFFEGQSCDDSPVASTPLLCGALCERVGSMSVGVSCGGQQSETLTCVQGNNGTGKWDEEPSQCTPNGCPDLSAPDHGLATCTGREEGDICQISCNSGFRLQHPAQSVVATCRGGVWETPQAKVAMLGLECVRLNCGTPRAVTGGSYQCDSQEFGSVCALACDEGYAPALSAPLEAHCSSLGEWDGWVPSPCEPTQPE